MKKISLTQVKNNSLKEKLFPPTILLIIQNLELQANSNLINIGTHFANIYFERKLLFQNKLLRSGINGNYLSD